MIVLPLLFCIALAVLGSAAAGAAYALVDGAISWRIRVAATRAALQEAGLL